MPKRANASSNIPIINSFKVIFKPIYFLLYIIYCGIVLRTTIFTATFQSWIRFKAKGLPNEDEVVDRLSEAFIFIQFTGAFSIPALGFIFNYIGKNLKRRFSLTHNQTSFLTGLMIVTYTLVTYFLVDLLMLVPGTGWSVYLVCILTSSAQQSFYSGFSIVVFGICRQEYHGRVLGFTSFLGLGMNFMIPVLIAIVVDQYDANWNVMNMLVQKVFVLHFTSKLIPKKSIFLHQNWPKIAQIYDFWRFPSPF